MSQLASLNSKVFSGNNDYYAYLQKINKFPILSLEEERSLAFDLRNKSDVLAAQKLVTSHLRLVVKIALTYKNYGLSMMDVISEGNIGLMKAVKKFDIDKGFRLSTYAMWWIRAQIQEYILQSWSLVKIGTTIGQKKLFFNLNKIKNKILSYDQKHVTKAQIADISKQLGVLEKDVVNMEQRLSCGDVYLYDAIPNSNSEDENCLMDVLPDENELPDEVCAAKQEKEQRNKLLYQAVNSLNDREKAIIMSRKLSDSPLTLEQLSKNHNISKERVRQIEARSLEKMKIYFADHVCN
jgi:RNA polymerase sigma-32 factor